MQVGHFYILFLSLPRPARGVQEYQGLRADSGPDYNFPKDIGGQGRNLNSHLLEPGLQCASIETEPEAVPYVLPFTKGF